MCELFAMSSRRPSTVNYSLNRFAEHLFKLTRQP